MSKEIAKTGAKALSSVFKNDSVRKKFQDVLGKKANGFMTSVLSIVSSNNMLSESDTNSIYTSALVAASLDLPINPNLGLAYIIPYNQRQKDGSWKKVAQFQIGAKGFKQLAQRSGQFLTINDTDVREGEIVKNNRLTGEIEFDWIDDKERDKRKIVGYVSYFKLRNGFEHTFYMTVEELKAHGKEYSKSYKYDSSIWKQNFDAMARKTVTKLNLSKNAPLSIEMQTAQIADQSSIKSFDTETNSIDVDYVDNDERETKEQQIKNKEHDRVLKHINNSKTKKELKQVQNNLSSDDLLDAYNKKMAELKK